jgi:hypothetical protein
MGGKQYVRITEPDQWFTAMLKVPAHRNCPEILKGAWWMQDNPGSETICTFHQCNWLTRRLAFQDTRKNFCLDASNIGGFAAATFILSNYTSRIEISPNDKWINLGGFSWMYVIQPDDDIRDKSGQPIDVEPGDMMRCSYLDEPVDPQYRLTGQHTIMFQYLVRRIAYLDPESGVLVRTKAYDTLYERAAGPSSKTCCGEDGCGYFTLREVPENDWQTVGIPDGDAVAQWHASIPHPDQLKFSKTASWLYSIAPSQNQMKHDELLPGGVTAGQRVVSLIDHYHGDETLRQGDVCTVHGPSSSSDTGRVNVSGPSMKNVNLFPHQFKAEVRYPPTPQKHPHDVGSTSFLIPDRPSEERSEKHPDTDTQALASNSGTEHISAAMRTPFEVGDILHVWSVSENKWYTDGVIQEMQEDRAMIGYKQCSRAKFLALEQLQDRNCIKLATASPSDGQVSASVSTDKANVSKELTLAEFSNHSFAAGDANEAVSASTIFKRKGKQQDGD